MLELKDPVQVVAASAKDTDTEKPKEDKAKTFLPPQPARVQKKRFVRSVKGGGGK